MQCYKHYCKWQGCCVIIMQTVSRTALGGGRVPATRQSGQRTATRGGCGCSGGRKQGQLLWADGKEQKADRLYRGSRLPFSCIHVLL